MVPRISLALLLCVAAGTSAFSQNYKTALGLRLSSNAATVNNSISIKHFINSAVALEGLLSVDPAAIAVLAEVHQPVHNAIGLRWLLGGGGFIGLKDGISLGAHGIAGLDYKFSKIPLNLTADWKPELDFTNDFRFEPAVVGLSARFTLR